MADALQAFLAKVERRPGGCWLWRGPRSGSSGQFHHGGRTVSPRRFAFEQFVGEIPGRRLVHVACGEHWCVNPEHLYASTPGNRFWRYVDTSGDGCWEWTAALTGHGYGMFHVGQARGLVPAHRYAYELEHGPIPDDLFICHHCDNKRCVRPDHLYAGTPEDNARDAIERGQIARGERHGMAVLTSDQVEEIRGAAGRSGASLAEEYGVSQTTISCIRRRESWKGVRS